MCGIAGVIDFGRKNRVQNETLQNMAELLHHRGPDEKGFYLSEDRNLGAVSARLSIIDLKNGKQPQWNESRTAFVIQNGEIYNFQEIRAALQAEGHTFRSTSDTETIVHLYDRYGKNFPEHLVGMFALFLWDSKEQKAFLARDRVGKKPLYYYQDSSLLVFASELQTILRCGLPLRFDSDLQGTYDFFRFGNTVGENSILKNIRKVPPGSLVEIDIEKGELQKSRYWRVPKVEPNIDISFEEAAGEFEKRFLNAVERRLIADVPIGAFLSGGMDSSAVAVASKKLGKRLKTFTIGFTEDRYDESTYARKVSEYLGLENRVTYLDQKIGNAEAKKVMSTFDEPFFDHSGIPTYYLSRFASEELKVVLSGDGGDELLLGYPHYDHYFRAPHRFVSRLPRPIQSMLGQLKVKNWDRFFERWFSRATPAYLTELLEDPPHASVFDELAPEYQSGDFYDFVSKMDFNQYLVDDILVKVDRMSMQASLEVRCPLLDQDLAEFLGRLPSQIRFGGKGEKKALLKNFLRKEIKDPDVLEAIFRPKHGFRFPMDRFLQAMGDQMLEIPRNKLFIDFFNLNPQTVQEIVEDFCFEKKDQATCPAWLVYSLYSWYQENEANLG